MSLLHELLAEIDEAGQAGRGVRNRHRSEPFRPAEGLLPPRPVSILSTGLPLTLSDYPNLSPAYRRATPNAKTPTVDRRVSAAGLRIRGDLPPPITVHRRCGGTVDNAPLGAVRTGSTPPIECPQ